MKLKFMHLCCFSHPFNKERFLNYWPEMCQNSSSGLKYRTSFSELNFASLWNLWEIVKVFLVLLICSLLEFPLVSPDSQHQSQKENKIPLGDKHKTRAQKGFHFGTVRNSNLMKFCCFNTLIP